MNETHIDIIKDFLPIIGVLFGFLLATVKDYYQNRPRIKMEQKMGTFNYYYTYTDASGISTERECLPHHASHLKLELIIDIYNYGMRNSAIKDVGIEVQAYRSFTRFFQPEMHIREDMNKDFSFNLPSNSILTMNLSLTIDKEEDTETYFNEDISLLPDCKDRLLFSVITTDLKNKRRKVIVEPISILTAY